MIKVTLIVPVYNASVTLKRLQQSVQSHELDITLCFIDDCSTDFSYEVLQQLENSDSNIIVKRLENNSGVSAARNAGLTLIPDDTDYVFFLDADDWLEPNALDELVEIAEKNNSEIVMGQLETFNGESFVPHIYNKWFFHTERYINSIGEFPELLLCPTLSNKIIKYDLIKKLDLRFIEKRYYAEDFHFSLRLLLNAKGISVTTDKIINFQDLGQENAQTSLWNTSNPERAWNTLQSVKDMHEYLVNNGHDKYRDMILYHSIYRFPRNINFMVNDNEWLEYLSAIQTWLKQEKLTKIPYGFNSEGIEKQASLKSYMIMRLILAGKFEIVKEVVLNNYKLGQLIFDMIKHNRLPVWNSKSKVSELPCFTMLNSNVINNRPPMPSVLDRIKQLTFIVRIGNSGLFDKIFYRNSSSSFWAKRFPLLHYLIAGCYEGKDPSENFSTNGYYHFRPDVKEAKLNALGHFVKYGVFEI